MLKTLDFNPKCVILGLSVVARRTGKLLAGPTVPSHPGFGPANESPSQFESDSVRKTTVALGHCVTPGKTNGPHKHADSQGWRNPRNGLHDATLYADAEVNEKNKPYLTIRKKDTSLLLGLERMAVCLESEFGQEERVWQPEEQCEQV